MSSDIFVYLNMVGCLDNACDSFEKYWHTVIMTVATGSASFTGALHLKSLCITNIICSHVILTCIPTK